MHGNKAIHIFIVSLMLLASMSALMHAGTYTVRAEGPDTSGLKLVLNETYDYPDGDYQSDAGVEAATYGYSISSSVSIELGMAKAVYAIGYYYYQEYGYSRFSLTTSTIYYESRFRFPCFIDFDMKIISDNDYAYKDGIFLLQKGTPLSSEGGKFISFYFSSNYNNSDYKNNTLWYLIGNNENNRIKIKNFIQDYKLHNIGIKISDERHVEFYFDGIYVGSTVMTFDIPQSFQIRFGAPASKEYIIEGDEGRYLENLNKGVYVDNIRIYATDIDYDEDGVWDSEDAFPNDPAASVDTDGDGYPDEWNEGMNETNSTTGLHLDAFPNDPAASVDSDGDGWPDEWNSGMSESDSTTGLHLDAFPNDPAASVDTDGDGYPDEWNSGMSGSDSTTGLHLDDCPTTYGTSYKDKHGCPDDDRDGWSNEGDAFPDDPAASVDTDGDGYPDEWNENMTEADSTTGLHLDAFPFDPHEWRDSDGDGIGDNSDFLPTFNNYILYALIALLIVALAYVFGKKGIESYRLKRELDKSSEEGKMRARELIEELKSLGADTSKYEKALESDDVDVDALVEELENEEVEEDISEDELEF